MDLSLQVRSLDLMVKLLRRDFASVPSYGFKRQKPACLTTRTFCALERSTPEREGLSSAAVERLLSELNAREHTIAPHAFMLLLNNKVVSEAAWAPYSTGTPYMLYSLSKSFTGTAIGIAADEGLLSLDESLADIFPEYVPISYLRQHKFATVRQLLAMSTGNRFNEVGSMVDENWVKMFMESLQKFEPGSSFEYNSMNTYMLAAILTRKTGMTLVDYLSPRLFEPLGIRHAAWEKCPMGVEKGGWGLYVRLEDAAKLGQLYLQKGVWEGRRILSEAWVEAATARQSAALDDAANHGYGYQIWVNDDGSYQFNGAFGQYVMVLPKHNAVVALYAGCADLFARGDLLKLVHSTLFSKSEKQLPQNEGALSSLRALESSLSLSFPKAAEGLNASREEFTALAALLDGREFRLSQTHAGLFPLAVQSVQGNFTAGADLLRFTREGEKLLLTFYEHTERNTFAISADGAWQSCAVAMRGERFEAAASARWALTNDAARLFVMLPFVETPHVRLLSMVWDRTQNALSVTFDELPSIEKATMMLLDLLGISRMAVIKYLAPFMQKSGERLSETMRRLYAPTAEGLTVAQNDVLAQAQARARTQALLTDDANMLYLSK